MKQKKDSNDGPDLRPPHYVRGPGIKWAWTLAAIGWWGAKTAFRAIWDAFSRWTGRRQDRP